MLGKTEYLNYVYGKPQTIRVYTDNSNFLTTNIVYNSYLQPQSVTDNSIKTEYTYDGVGNVTSVKDGNGNVTKYSYDKFNNLIKTENPDGTYSNNVINYSSNFIEKYDENRNKVTYKFDVFGNLTTITAYDKAGNARVLKTYGYDRLFRRSGETTTSPASVTKYTYDFLNRLETKTITGENSKLLYSETRAYEKYGLPRYDGVIKDIKDNDGLGTKTTITIKLDDKKTLTSYEITDFFGRAVEKNDGIKTIKSQYDMLGNLNYEEICDKMYTSYSYDYMGNLLSTDINNGDVITKTDYDWAGRKKYDYDANAVSQNSGYSVGYEYNEKISYQMLKPE